MSLNKILYGGVNDNRIGSDFKLYLFELEALFRE